MAGAADPAQQQARNQASESRRQMEMYHRAMIEQIKLARQLVVGPNPAAPRLAPLDSPGAGSLEAMTPVDLGERAEYFEGTSLGTGHITWKGGARNGFRSGGRPKRATMTSLPTSPSHTAARTATDNASAPGKRPDYAKVEVHATYRQ